MVWFCVSDSDRCRTRKGAIVGDRERTDGARNRDGDERRQFVRFALSVVTRARVVTRREGDACRSSVDTKGGHRRDRPTSDRIVVPCYHSSSFPGDDAGRARTRHPRSTYRVHLRVFLLPRVDIILGDGRHRARGRALPSPRVARWRNRAPFRGPFSCPSERLTKTFATERRIWHLDRVFFS